MSCKVDSSLPRRNNAADRDAVSVVGSNTRSSSTRPDESGKEGHIKPHDAPATRHDSRPEPSPVLRKRKMSVGNTFSGPSSPGSNARGSTSAAGDADGDDNDADDDDDPSNDAKNRGVGSSDRIQNGDQRQRRQSTTHEDRTTTDAPRRRNENNNQRQRQRGHEATQLAEGMNDPDEVILVQRFWRTYDAVIILSISSVFGIMFRMMSATWFRLELGAVFSEDSALGTNLPLNIWSCFLMGFLCSGREAMGIVHSKVLGGANPHGSGRGILEVGKGAYRGAVDAGKAGINRARGYGNVRGRKGGGCDDGTNSLSTLETKAKEPSGNGHEASPSNTGLHRRRGDPRASADSIATSAVGGRGGDRPPGAEGSIATLLGLDDEFRRAGSRGVGEDEAREVQLRGLTRRIMASPSLVLFPARKEDHDVMEHYENDLLSPSHAPAMHEDQFEIGDLDDDSGGDVESGDIEMNERSTSSSGEASGEASGQQNGVSAPPRSASSPAESQQPLPTESSNNSTSSNTHPRQPPESTSTIEGQVDEMIHSIGDRVTTLRRVRLLDGWSTDTSPEKMKHILLLGLRVGFCGALSTFSSLNAGVIRLLRAGAVGEALVGYALSIQLGVVSYRFGQHLAVYAFVWRCRRETTLDQRRGYGLRLRGPDADEWRGPPGPGGSSARGRRCVPSVRTIATLSFLSMFASLCLAIYFSTERSHPRRAVWCSLLFTPFGCLARFALISKYNKKLPGFPLGTFSCNLLSCALSGSLGSFLAGNPGPEESIVLISMIAGFAGSLSTFATFIVEILSLMDPIIFKFDGLVYAAITILWAVIIGYLGSQAKNWADEI